MTLRSMSSAAAVSCLFLASTAQAADPGCWRAEEIRAARLQGLQQVLMVDALKCQDTLPATVASYNGFLAKRRDMLVQNKYAVQAHFVRLLGPVEGMKAAANHDTQVGNRMSAAGIDVKRCETTGLYARLATEAAEDDLLMMAALLTGGDAPVACAVETAAPAPAASPAAMVIPVWKKPAAPVAVAAPESSLSPAVVQAAAARPLPVGDTAALIAQVRREKAAGAAPVSAPALLTAAPPAPVPVTVAALTPIEAPDQQRADTLKALQAAAAALAQAAESIRPAPGGLAMNEQ